MKNTIKLVKNSVEKQLKLRNNDYWREQIPEKCPPVLWFGDHKARENIVTVGLNPSSREFFKNRNEAKNKRYLDGSEKRFYVFKDDDLEKYHDPVLLYRVLQSYDNYFRGNPYTRWFGKPEGYNIELFINQWNASFYRGIPLGCVHIDLIPFVTISKFSDLDEMRLRDDILSDSWFQENFHQLIDFLNPKYMIIFGRRAVQYFNEYYGGRLNLDHYFSINEKKLSRYGFSEIHLSGKRIPLVGLSVNLGNPRGFNKESLREFGSTMYRVMSKNSNDLSTVLTLPFLLKPISKSILELALSHERNKELANMGDGVLRLVIREYFYKRNSNADKIQKEEEKYVNNEYLSLIAAKLNLDRYITSSSGLGQNPNINEAYARTLEAIIGAVYQENGLREARSFVKKNILV